VTDQGVVVLVAAWATLPPLIGVTIYDVVGRQSFNTSSTRLMELEWHLFLAAWVPRRHPLILRSRALP
jgi:TRAP-type mannitol/chloroaromatic compound transport system permease small subunit